jgi:hypothetical protein
VSDGLKKWKNVCMFVISSMGVKTFMKHIKYVRIRIRGIMRSGQGSLKTINSEQGKITSLLQLEHCPELFLSFYPSHTGHKVHSGLRLTYQSAYPGGSRSAPHAISRPE